MGWKDATRGTVFWNIIQILEYHSPKFLILENVAHFVKHDKGNTYQKVYDAITKLGYKLHTRKFSPNQFGIPQVRERIYMVGIRADLTAADKFQWPEPEEHSTNIRSILDSKPKHAKQLSSNVISCIETWQIFLDLIDSESKLPSFPIWSMEFGATYPYEARSLREFSTKKLQSTKGIFGKSLTGMTREHMNHFLPSYVKGDGEVFPKWKQNFIRQNREFYQQHKKVIHPWLSKIKGYPASLQKLEWNCQGEKRYIWDYLLQFRASGLRVKRTQTSPSLVAMTSTQVPIIGWEKRYMTPRECARLQSMDKLKYLPASETSSMKALGNAVNVEVVRNILNQIHFGTRKIRQTVKS
jgi:DNA (cytosine-5)-methyltransferase 1